MFHEIIKHSRKIKEKMEEKKESSERWKEILTEVLIIIFAVSLSTWFHDLGEHRSHQKEVKEFLVDLRDDLNKDLVGLKAQNKAIAELVNQFKFARGLNKTVTDSLDKSKAKYPLNTGFRLFFGEENKGNYESFESGGKTVFIENKKLKRLILSYYNHHIPATQKTGETFADSFTKLGDFITRNVTVGKSGSSAFLDSGFQTDVEISIKHANENTRIANLGILKIQEIIAEINKELEK